MSCAAHVFRTSIGSTVESVTCTASRKQHCDEAVRQKASCRKTQSKKICEKGVQNLDPTQIQFVRGSVDKVISWHPIHRYAGPSTSSGSIAVRYRTSVTRTLCNMPIACLVRPSETNPFWRTHCSFRLCTCCIAETLQRTEVSESTGPARQSLGAETPLLARHFSKFSSADERAGVGSPTWGAVRDCARVKEIANNSIPSARKTALNRSICCGMAMAHGKWQRSRSDRKALQHMQSSYDC